MRVGCRGVGSQGIVCPEGHLGCSYFGRIGDEGSIEVEDLEFKTWSWGFGVGALELM